jgi:hypothetical protein
MKTILSRVAAALLATVLAGGLQAQTTAPAGPKVALTSLVGDTMTVTVYRERTGSNIRSNAANTVKVTTPVFDVEVLKTLQESLAQALPAASVSMLRVPAAGSSGDPALLFDADGKLVPASPLVEALRQQGFTHLVAVTRHRAPNGVTLADKVIVGTGHLEGIGFYIDHSISVQNVRSADSSQGIIAPHLYVRLNLIDVAAGELRATEPIAASSLVAAYRNPAGTDPWGALTAEEKLSAVQRLIRARVGASAPLLFQTK